jgi:hypothetical protein
MRTRQHPWAVTDTYTYAYAHTACLSPSYLVRPKAPPAPYTSRLQPRQRLRQHSIAPQAGSGVAMLQPPVEDADNLVSGGQQFCCHCPLQRLLYHCRPAVVMAAAVAAGGTNNQAKAMRKHCLTEGYS